ncbi:MAG TPA: hypothetical protein DCO83_06000 [Mucilaginibacter sp.]|jgi:hypothetical protein|nr:hypothetical protein [Mucilaginibacter sp.]
MIAIKLNNELLFSIEPHKKRVRLIVHNGEVENVCRIIDLKTLEHFILSDEKSLFKGRLQLHKNIAGLGIEVKGKIAGMIKTEDLINCVEEAIF